MLCVAVAAATSAAGWAALSFARADAIAGVPGAMYKVRTASLSTQRSSRHARLRRSSPKASRAGVARGRAAGRGAHRRGEVRRLQLRAGERGGMVRRRAAPDGVRRVGGEGRSRRCEGRCQCVLVDVRRELAEAAAKVELGLGLGERARIGLRRRGERRADNAVIISESICSRRAHSPRRSGRLDSIQRETCVGSVQPPGKRAHAH